MIGGDLQRLQEMHEHANGARMFPAGNTKSELSKQYEAKYDELSDHPRARGRRVMMKVGTPQQTERLQWMAEQAPGRWLLQALAQSLNPIMYY